MPRYRALLIGNSRFPLDATLLGLEGPVGATYFFDVTGDCAGPPLRWRLNRAGDQEAIFDAAMYLGGTCFDVGPVSIPVTGDYELAVSGAEGEVGDYAFRVVEAPVERFPLAVGDTVGPDEPGPGAGRIDTAGAADAYRFDAAGGETLFDVTGECTGEVLRWRLARAGQEEVLFDSPMRLGGACLDPAPVTLPVGGEYELRVAGDGDDLGGYGFTVHDATPQRFALAVGDTVAPACGPGSRADRAPGSADVFTLTAAGGETLSFVPTGPCDGEVLRWRLTRAGEQSAVFDTAMRLGGSCLNPDPVPLVAGEYELRVSGDGDDLGDYGFEVRSVP